jgi:hypothetical protein
MDLTDFGRDLIKRWEHKTGCLHRGDIEISEGNILPYFDHRFVKDLIDYAEILFNRHQDVKSKLVDVLKITKE